MIDVRLDLSLPLELLSIAQTHDIEVSFVEPASRRAVFELAALPGVREAEPLRSVPVRLVHGLRSYRTSIEGVPAGARLRRPIDARLRPVQPQGDGVPPTDYLHPATAWKCRRWKATAACERRP